MCCIARVCWTYLACTFASPCSVSRRACCSLTPASASELAKARRNECQSTRRVVGVSWCTSWSVMPIRPSSRRSRWAYETPRSLRNSPDRAPFVTGNTGPASGAPWLTCHARRISRIGSGTTNVRVLPVRPRFAFARCTLTVAKSTRSHMEKSQRLSSDVRMPPSTREHTARTFSSRSRVSASLRGFFPAGPAARPLRNVRTCSSVRIFRCRSSILVCSGISTRATGFSLMTSARHASSKSRSITPRVFFTVSWENVRATVSRIERTKPGRTSASAIGPIEGRTCASRMCSSSGAMTTPAVLRSATHSFACAATVMVFAASVAIASATSSPLASIATIFRSFRRAKSLSCVSSGTQRRSS